MQLVEALAGLLQVFAAAGVLLQVVLVAQLAILGLGVFPKAIFSEGIEPALRLCGIPPGGIVSQVIFISLGRIGLLHIEPEILLTDFEVEDKLAILIGRILHPALHRALVGLVGHKFLDALHQLSRIQRLAGVFLQVSNHPFGKGAVLARQPVGNCFDAARADDAARAVMLVQYAAALAHHQGARKAGIDYQQDVLSLQGIDPLDDVGIGNVAP